ncbi:hypothetical protein ACG873_30265 [Mesorhizobium sp. AaZ16]|uniref:hypothetical protein n=1 Tax=Mesorhizobium sp. AaZ16 TaxID=3402289 RepID=UPI00374EA39C
MAGLALISFWRWPGGRPRNRKGHNMPIPTHGFFPRIEAVTVPGFGRFDLTKWEGLRAWIEVCAASTGFAIGDEYSCSTNDGDGCRWWLERREKDNRCYQDFAK